MTAPHTTTATVGRHPGLLLGASVVGAVLVMAGWWGASRQLVVGDQIGWANLATGGVVLGFAAEGVGLFRMRRAVQARQRDLVETRQRATGRITPPADAERVVVLPTLTFLHRANCLLVAGKLVDEVLLSSSEGTHRPRCGVCRP